MSIEPRWTRIDPTGLDARKLAHVLAKVCLGTMVGLEIRECLGWSDEDIRRYAHPSPRSVDEKIEADWYNRDVPSPVVDHSKAFGHDPDFEARANARRAIIREREEEFKRDALAELGLTDHPKADAIFNKAWNDGKSYGYGSVYDHLRELAELLA